MGESRSEEERGDRRGTTKRTINNKAVKAIHEFWTSLNTYSSFLSNFT